jgi:hypothetical protein
MEKRKRAAAPAGDSVAPKRKAKANQEVRHGAAARARTLSHFFVSP